MRLRTGNGLIAHGIFIVIAALVSSFLATLACIPHISARTAAAQKESAAIASLRQPSIFYARQGEAKPKLDFASFGVPESDPAQRRAEASAAPAGNIKNFKLVGTLPSIGAWVESGGKSSLVLKGDGLEGYKLDEIEPESAVFSREGEKYPLYLVYWMPNEKRAANTPPPPPPPPVNVQPTPEPPPAEVSDEPSGVLQAVANGDDGTITRELLNELLMNPLAEVGKMRLTPSDNGMRIMGMRDDSLFSKLGMSPGDVIKSVNGIGISDVGNVSNVISSMMSGTRLDFQVEREGEPVKLGYAVK
jgi:type II secretory pathway component PulC